MLLVWHSEPKVRASRYLYSGDWGLSHNSLP